MIFTTSCFSKCSGCYFGQWRTQWSVTDNSALWVHELFAYSWFDCSEFTIVRHFKVVVSICRCEKCWVRCLGVHQIFSLYLCHRVTENVIDVMYVMRVARTSRELHLVLKMCIFSVNQPSRCGYTSFLLASLLFSTFFLFYCNTGQLQYTYALYAGKWTYSRESM